MNKGTAILLAILLLLVAIPFYIMKTNGGEDVVPQSQMEIPPAAIETAPAPEDTTATTPDDAPAADDLTPPTDIDAADAMLERSIGNAEAPITIVEYASLTCSHCANFANEVLPEIKKSLIETGKARLVFRDFPLDALAMKAAMMARCAAPDQYFGLLEVLFKNQKRWMESKDPEAALIQLGSLTGMDESYIKTCMNDTALKNAMVAVIQEAQNNYRVQSTPTFVFNNGAEQFSGGDLKKFEEVTSRLLHVEGVPANGQLQ